MPTATGEARNAPTRSAEAVNALHGAPTRARSPLEVLARFFRRANPNPGRDVHTVHVQPRFYFDFHVPSQMALQLQEEEQGFAQLSVDDRAVRLFEPQAPIAWGTEPRTSIGMVVLPVGTRISPSHPFAPGYSIVAVVEVSHGGYVISSGDLGEARGISWEDAYTRFLRRKHDQSEQALRRSYGRLDEIRLLPEGWDAYSARPISDTAVATAKNLLSYLRDSDYVRLGERVEPYAVVPLSTGGVQLEWRGSRGSLEVEAKPDGHLGYLLELREGNVAEEDDATSEGVLTLLERVL